MVLTLPKIPSFFHSYTDWLEKQQGSILSAAVVITTASIASALSGFLRKRLLIDFFFDTSVSRQAFEAFTVASQIPDTIFQLVVLGALSAAFIPLFSQYRKQSDEEAFRMTNQMMTLLLVIFFCLSMLVMIFAEPLTRITTGEAFTAEQVAIATQLTRIMLGAQFFFAISNFFTGMLQSYRRFILPALAPILYNVGILIGVWLTYPFLGIYSTGVGVVFGAFLHMAIQLPSVYRLGFRFRPTLIFHHPGIKSLLHLAPPRTITLGIGQLQELANNFFTTSIGNLSRVVMDLAGSLVTLPTRFFGAPIGQATLPFLVDEAHKEDRTGFRDLVLQSIHQISFFAFPASVLLLILRLPIVRIAYGTHNFPWESTKTTALVVGIISLSITFQSVVQLLIRAFYALKNTRIPFYISLATVGLYLTLTSLLVFVWHLGIVGIAVSTTIVSIVEMFLFLALLNKEVPGFMSKTFWFPQLKMITASFLMAVFLYLPFRILDEIVFNTSRSIELLGLTITTATIGLVVYVYFSVLFDVRELHLLQQVMNKFGNWRKILIKSPEVLLESSTDNEIR